MGEGRWVVWIAGAGAPPEESFAGCIGAIGDAARSLTKGLELFEQDHPVPDYSLAIEVAGVLRAMDEAGIERAHVVGYSGGGGVALALAIEHPDRVLSLAVDEHVVGHRFGVEDEDRFWADLDAALLLEGLDATLGVIAATNAPGAPPPDLGDPPPPWLLSRVAGTPLLARAARDHSVSRADLAGIRCPVYGSFGSGTRTTFKRWCEELTEIVGRGHAERYDGCDHFRPAHQVHPDRFAAALLAHWEASES